VIAVINYTSVIIVVEIGIVQLVRDINGKNGLGHVKRNS
jgi:hypothetical protein